MTHPLLAEDLDRVNAALDRPTTIGLAGELQWSPHAPTYLSTPLSTGKTLFWFFGKIVYLSSSPESGFGIKLAFLVGRDADRASDVYGGMARPPREIDAEKRGYGWFNYRNFRVCLSNLTSSLFIDFFFTSELEQAPRRLRLHPSLPWEQGRAHCNRIQYYQDG